MVKRDPAPGVLSTWMAPPLWVTIPYTIESPSPLPMDPLVV